MTFHPDIPADYRNAIVTGDARELARAIPDASVDLVFTDPVYSERPLYDWLAKEARRVLKPGGAVLCWSNGKWHRTNTNWLEAGGLTYRHDFAMVMLGGPMPMNGRIIAKTQRLVWLDVCGKSKMIDCLVDGYQDVFEANTSHKWVKSRKFTTRALNAFAPSGAVVFDPFCGGGTNPHICKKLGFHYIAFEIDELTAERARERVALTQAMEPVLLGIQEPMELAV